MTRLKQKQAELIQNFKDWCKVKSIHDEETAIEIAKRANVLESEISALQEGESVYKPQQPIGSTTDFVVQTRELTDEEWLKLPKEEILQLYKNCYKMLNLSDDYDIHIPLQVKKTIKGKLILSREARQEINSDLIDIIECIKNYDDTAPLKEKGRDRKSVV